MFASPCSPTPYARNVCSRPNDCLGNAPNCSWMAQQWLFPLSQSKGKSLETDNRHPYFCFLFSLFVVFAFNLTCKMTSAINIGR